MLDVDRKRPETALLLAARGFASAVGMHPEAQRLNSLSEKIIGAAIVVHRGLGPGLLEAPYEECLCHELEKLGLRFERQRPLPLVYGDVKLACAYRMDLVVEKSIVVEVKAVARIERVHEAQLLSYLRFNVRNLARQGIVRRVLDFPE